MKCFHYLSITVAFHLASEAFYFSDSLSHLLIYIREGF